MPRSFLVKKPQSAKKPNYGRLDFNTEGIPACPNEGYPLRNDVHTSPPPSRALPSPWHCGLSSSSSSSSSSLLPPLRTDRAGQRRERRRPHSPSSTSFLKSVLPHSSIPGHHLGTPDRYSGTLTDPYTGASSECSRTPRPPSDACRTQESHLTHNLDGLFSSQDHRTPEERGCRETHIPSSIPPSMLPSFPLLALLPPNPSSCGLGNDRFECFDCHKGYAVMSPGLAEHGSFHREWPSHKYFSCKYCEKEYTSLGALKMHIRTHTLPCICKLCGKAFSRPWLLQGHIRTHTGEKPFSCPHCSRAFADRSNLRAHLQTHTDVKKYQCSSCSKTFSRISLLVKHQEAGCCPLP